MTAILRLRNSLHEHQVDEAIIEKIFEGYENISDKGSKKKRALFFIEAIERMEKNLSPEACRDVREDCTCSKGGWRLKETQRIGREYQGKSIEEILQALGTVKYMGKPVLNADGTITGGVGDQGGFECPCPVFNGVELEQTVSKTYCFCCAGHFKHHYQVALGRKLETVAVTSSILDSRGKEPCRFVFRLVEAG